ncbi:MAG TPA: DUF3744 domain-containing protein [Sphaerochaeta sp.]|nr:DUF3744 domain-containing protein [Sphaerochaeta sp.]
MDDHLITFEEFSFTYRSQSEPTLKAINLTIKRGEKVLIVGPSGSGKSTLGYCINALIPNAFEGTIEGRAEVCGLEVGTSSIYEVNKLVGTVMQDTDAQFVALTVGEDIAFSLENQCTGQAQMHSRVREMATVVDMASFLSQSPADLSGGQKQRVSLAGVLVDDVEVLLFDEPLANLDPATGRHAITLIDEISRSTEKTIIIIEHRLEDVLAAPVDRIIAIDDGRIVSDSTPEQLLKSTILLELGIREPLYLAALRLAGCDITALGDVSALERMDLGCCASQVRSWHQEKRTLPVVPNEEPMLEITDLGFSYDGIVDALDDINLSVQAGEMVSILGSNGAGKSTLASLLMGVLHPDRGTIVMDGQDLGHYSASQRSSLIGFVMQNPNHMISCDVVYDEVAFALRQQGYGEDEIRDRVMDVLGLCGLREYHQWPISALSYGQKKRVTIASILVTRARLLILDEPTAGQDWRRYTALMEFLSDLNRRLGLTILFITHDMHLALQYTHRSVVLDGGHLICDKRTSEVFSDEEILKTANLEVTSLYRLAKACKIEEIPSFIETFVTEEAHRRGEGVRVAPLTEKPIELIGKPKQKKRRPASKEGRKFGFALRYEAGESILHRLSGVTKFVGFIIWIIFCLTTFDIRFLIPATIAAFALLSMSRIPLSKFKPYIIAMITLIAMNALFIFLFSPDQGTRYLGSRTILFGSPHWRYALSLETLFYLFVVSLKYFSIFPMALLFVSITQPSEFASSLNRLGLSYRISYAVSLALRYLPEVTNTYVHILHAQMARGVSFSSDVPIKKRFSSLARVLSPLVLSSLDRIDVITNAMVLRGFGRMERRTWYMESRLSAGDYMIMATLLLLLAFSLYSRFARHVMFWYPF